MGRWLSYLIRGGDPSDFLPIVIGCTILLVSVPGFLAVLLFPDRNAGPLAPALLIVLGSGIVLGTVFVVIGIRILLVSGIAGVPDNPWPDIFPVDPRQV